LFATSLGKAAGKEEAVPEKRTKYQERIKVLREQAKDGNMRAMQELHKRYHIGQIMINGELVNLKQRLGESLSRY
jgi:hypothetical protein